MSYKIKYTLRNGAAVEVENLTMDGIIAGFEVHVAPVIEDDGNSGTISYVCNNRKVSEDGFFFGFEKPKIITKYRKETVSTSGDA